jgi:hypothetical protein
MFFYIHHSYTQAVQYVLVDVPPYQAGDLVPYDRQHQQTEGHQHRHVDVHSVRKI